MDKVIILFDEQGTPTFRAKRESNNFLGIGIAYNQRNEESMFNECNQLFGLLKSKPLKNDKISNSRALEIAGLISTMDILIYIASISLIDNNFQNTVNSYGELSNLIRKNFRNVRPRSEAQIIHFHTLLPVFFNVIMSYIKHHQTPTTFSIFMDNWSFPEKDKAFIISSMPLVLTEKANEMNMEFFPDVTINCDKFELLEKDSNRKRFIDVIASIISRNYLDENNPKFLYNIIKTISKGENIIIEQRDITQKTTEDFKKL